MGEIKYIGGLLMAGIFALSLIIFAITFAVDNDAHFSLADSDDFNETRTEILGNLTQYHTEVVNSSDSFYESEIQEGETVRTGGQFKLGPGTALTTSTSVMKQGFRTIFGSDGAFAWILTTIISFLGFMLVLYIWKTWAGRNPE